MLLCDCVWCFGRWESVSVLNVLKAETVTFAVWGNKSMPIDCRCTWNEMFVSCFVHFSQPKQRAEEVLRQQRHREEMNIRQQQHSQAAPPPYVCTCSWFSLHLKHVLHLVGRKICQGLRARREEMTCVLETRVNQKTLSQCFSTS